MVKVLKFIICAVVILLLFIIYESNLCAKCDYTFFVEERLMGRLLIAIDTNDINLVRYIAAEGRVCKQANVHNRALKELRKMESENNRTMSKPVLQNTKRDMKEAKFTRRLSYLLLLPYRLPPYFPILRRFLKFQM